MISQQNPVRVFVTHAWVNDDEYLRLFEFLESARGFYYRNVTRPEARPAGTRDAELDELRRQIDQAEVVIALAAQYPGNAFWLDFQATYGKAVRKPLLLLGPFGTAGALPPSLKSLADATVEWSERALVDALRRLARNETSKRWETVEFRLD